MVPEFLEHETPDNTVISDGIVNVTTLPVNKGQLTVIEISNFVEVPVAPLTRLERLGVKVVRGDNEVI